VGAGIVFFPLVSVDPARIAHTGPPLKSLVSVYEIKLRSAENVATSKAFQGMSSPKQFHLADDSASCPQACSTEIDTESSVFPAACGVGFRLPFCWPAAQQATLPRLDVIPSNSKAIQDWR
jgi:hypothetical protein